MLFFPMIRSSFRTVYQGRRLDWDWRGRFQQGLSVLDLPSAGLIARNNNHAEAHLWHWHMGHPFDSVLNIILPLLLILVPVRYVVMLNNTDCLSPLEPVHLQSCLNQFIQMLGDAPIDSRDGFKFFASCIDDKFGCTLLYSLLKVICFVLSKNSRK